MTLNQSIAVTEVTVLSDIRVYYSDFFDVDEDIIDGYGAVNIVSAQ